MRIAIAILTLWGCSSTAAPPKPYVVGNAVCVDAASTADRPARDSSPPANCKGEPDLDLALPVVRERAMCGPCGFTFDPATTASERAKSPNTCCYQVSSPPPPPPPGGDPIPTPPRDPTP